MRKRSFYESVDNLFFERIEQLTLDELPEEYHELSKKHSQLYEELKEALPNKMHLKLIKYSDTGTQMEASYLDILYEQAFLEGAQLMRYLLQNEKPIISGSIREAIKLRQREEEQIKHVS